MKVACWMVRAPGEPMVWEERDARAGPGEVIVEVAGCGLCHTDLGFYYEGVPTRHPFPLALGHEVSGTVVAVGEGAAEWLDKHVVVPAVIPCGECAACRSGNDSVCPRQIFPGCDVHGGFASHLRIPAVFSHELPQSRERDGPFEMKMELHLGKLCNPVPQLLVFIDFHRRSSFCFICTVRNRLIAAAISNLRGRAKLPGWRSGR